MKFNGVTSVKCGRAVNVNVNVNFNWNTTTTTTTTSKYCDDDPLPHLPRPQQMAPSL